MQENKYHEEAGKQDEMVFCKVRREGAQELFHLGVIVRGAVW
jgi:hypothetical protein